MNKRFFPMARYIRLGVFAGLVLPCAAAQAAEVFFFDVQGAITPSCGLAADRIRVDLGTVTSSELAGVGGASPWRTARFTGINCVGATRATVTLLARPHPANARLIAPSGGDWGVGIEVRAADGQALPPNGSTEARFSWSSGQPELGFEARYVRVGKLRPGVAAATATVQIRWD